MLSQRFGKLPVGAATGYALFVALFAFLTAGLTMKKPVDCLTEFDMRMVILPRCAELPTYPLAFQGLGAGGIAVATVAVLFVGLLFRFSAYARFRSVPRYRTKPLTIAVVGAELLYLLTVLAFYMGAFISPVPGALLIVVITATNGIIALLGWLLYQRSITQAPVLTKL